jgi:hypothetical protein
MAMMLKASLGPGRGKGEVSSLEAGAAAGAAEAMAAEEAMRALVVNFMVKVVVVVVGLVELVVCGVDR